MKEGSFVWIKVRRNSNKRRPAILLREAAPSAMNAYILTRTAMFGAQAWRVVFLDRKLSDGSFQFYEAREPQISSMSPLEALAWVAD